MYVVRTPERAAIAAALEEAGIASASYYVTPLHLQPAMAYLGYEPGSLPETERPPRRTSRCRCGADRRTSRSGRRAGGGRACGRARRWQSGFVRSPVNRHSIWQIAADAASSPRLVLAWMLRFDQGRPVYYDRIPRLADRPRRRRDPGHCLRTRRLLQPLVALRLDP
jgi:hypothetical protein